VGGSRRSAGVSPAVAHASCLREVALAVRERDAPATAGETLALHVSFASPTPRLPIPLLRRAAGAVRALRDRGPPLYWLDDRRPIQLRADCRNFSENNRISPLPLGLNVSHIFCVRPRVVSGHAFRRVIRAFGPRKFMKMPGPLSSVTAKFLPSIFDPAERSGSCVKAFRPGLLGRQRLKPAGGKNAPGTTEVVPLIRYSCQFSHSL
jgi:hypothetical protein